MLSLTLLLRHIISTPDIWLHPFVSRYQVHRSTLTLIWFVVGSLLSRLVNWISHQCNAKKWVVTCVFEPKVMADEARTKLRVWKDKISSSPRLIVILSQRWNNLLFFNDLPSADPTPFHPKKGHTEMESERTTPLTRAWCVFFYLFGQHRFRFHSLRCSFFHWRKERPWRRGENRRLFKRTPIRLEHQKLPHRRNRKWTQLQRYLRCQPMARRSSRTWLISRLCFIFQQVIIVALLVGLLVIDGVHSKKSKEPANRFNTFVTTAIEWLCLNSLKIFQFGKPIMSKYFNLSVKVKPGR